METKKRSRSGCLVVSIVAAFIALPTYVLSAGPFAWLVMQQILSQPQFELVYSPLNEIRRLWPQFDMWFDSYLRRWV